jgi:hypothetical protein
MKKLFFTLTASLLLTGAIFTSCDFATEKINNVKNSASEANEDFSNAKEEYLVDIENFKAETATKIEANNQKIEALNVRIEYAKKDVKAYSQEQINILEQKNSEMKIKLDEYKEDGKDNWEIFKTEFSSDMDDLGEAFKNFTVKNE